MRLIVSLRFSLGKCGKIWKNLLFFRADMAGLGKYCMSGYGRNGVYRVKIVESTIQVSNAPIRDLKYQLPVSGVELTILQVRNTPTKQISQTK